MFSSTPLEPNILLETFLDARLGQLAPPLHTWYSPLELKKNLRQELEEDLEWTHNLEWATQFHGNFGIGTPEDYRVRTLELPHLGTAWTHIRFWSGQKERPFVDLRASMHLPRSSAELHDVLDHLRLEHAPFQPKHLRLFLPAPSPLEFLPEGAFWEKRYLAAPLERLRSGPLPTALEGRPPAEGFYARYLETYRALQAAWPEHAEYAGTQDEEDFVDRDGAALELWWEGQYAGLVAASRRVALGLSGFEVDEVVLAPSARGQGLGPQALRLLADALPSRASDVLFGTVDARNTPAYRSALRSGREDVGGYLWVPFP